MTNAPLWESGALPTTNTSDERLSCSPPPLQSASVIAPAELGEVAAPVDLLAVAIAKVRAHLDPSLPVKKRIRALWAGAKAARRFAASDVVRDEFTALANESGVTHDLGYHGREDVAHVVNWALRGWDPFGD